MADFDGLSELTLPQAAGVVTSYDGAFVVRIANSSPPVVSNFVPTPGQRLDSINTPIQFDVTDVDPGIGGIYIGVEYPSGLSECAYMAGTFAPFFRTHSTRTSISNGFRFYLRRIGGWIEAPTITVHAVDGSGNLA